MFVFRRTVDPSAPPLSVGFRPSFVRAVHLSIVSPVGLTFSTPAATRAPIRAWIIPRRLLDRFFWSVARAANPNFARLIVSPSIPPGAGSATRFLASIWTTAFVSSFIMVRVSRTGLLAMGLLLARFTSSFFLASLFLTLLFAACFLLTGSLAALLFATSFFLASLFLSFFFTTQLFFALFFTTSLFFTLFFFAFFLETGLFTYSGSFLFR